MSEPYWELLGGGGTIGGPVMYAGAWAAGTTYQPGQVVRYNGVDYLAVATSLGQVPPAIAPAITGYGTSLPTTPYDGQEFVLVDSLTNPTFSWRFRYNAGSSSSFKWEFIGGPPLVGYSAGNVTNGGTTSTWINIVGTTVTIPRTGDYVIKGSCVVSHPTAGATSYAGVYTGSVGNVSTYGNFGFPAAGGYSGVIAFPPYRYNSLGAGGVVGVSGQSNVANGNFALVGWDITPVRVS